MTQRDPFANFARMRREMEQLFADAWPRPGYALRRGAGFSPRVDVYYCEAGAGAAPKAVIKVDLSGIEMNGVNIEISGRELVISGERPVQETEGRIYQQVEIDTGPFRRVIELSAEVASDQAKATYENGVLRIELPLVRAEKRSRTVPIERGEE